MPLYMYNIATCTLLVNGNIIDNIITVNNWLDKTVECHLQNDKYIGEHHLT